MFQRPKIGESEEDLLHQEEQFLKQHGKVPNRKRSQQAPLAFAKTAKQECIIGEIIEKNMNVSGYYNFNSIDNTKGFPNLFNVDPNITVSKKEKKSLFALHMERNKKFVVKDLKFPKANTDMLRKNSVHMDSQNNVNSCEKVEESICIENCKRLSEMSEVEILEAQKKLYETLHPNLIEFLKSRNKMKEENEMEVKSEPEDFEMKAADLIKEDIETEEKVKRYVGEKWLNMDFIEKEKLEWVGDIPDAKSLEPDQPYSARFDFKGELQPFNTKIIDVTMSLHHHGDEPERPGYTIQELYQLSRSSILQQRILAISTLANIIRKTKLGYYDTCFDGFLLHKLLESDLFLLLRFSIDENALIPVTINCLRKLLHNDTDEYCLDKLLGVTNDNKQPSLCDEIKVSKDEQKELKDNAIINMDLIRGVLRTDLLMRITYAFNNLSCDRETIINGILCFIRIARHSIDSSKEILKSCNLLNYVYLVINCEKPIYQGLKLFRILTGQSKEIASEIMVNFPMNFLISYVNSESMSDIPKSEFYLLKLESMYLWRNLLKHDFMTDEFLSLTPCLIRYLRFYMEKMDLCGEGDFDFEFFSAMLSLLTVCISKKLQIDTNYVAIIEICMEKWLKQLIHYEKFNFAGLKAVGSCFNFFITYFEVFEVDLTQLRLIQKFNTVISTFILSSVFEKLTQNLIRYSHILAVTAVKRDPKNLPSLCSVYEGGNDFVKIVNNESSAPFFISFVKYLQFSYSVTHESKINIKMFVKNSNIRKYIEKIKRKSKNVDNWFMRYEIETVTGILQLFYIVNDEETLNLGFRLLPMIRSDDCNAKSVLSILTDKKIWKSTDEIFDNLSEIYLESIYKPVPGSDLIMHYKNELIGDDWMYKPIVTFRGKDATAEMVKILKFLSISSRTKPELLQRVPYELRYYYLCIIFLTDSNVFDDEIQRELKFNFSFILVNREKVCLARKLDNTKSFYDLYTELITQYAGVSYGLHIFAELVLFPLQNKFDVSFRKLLWFEYLHVLRVITLPYPVSDFIELNDFVEPCEIDESLLITYLNSVSNNVIMKNRNPFIYNIAIGNIKNYLNSEVADAKLKSFLKQKIETVKNERVRQDLIIW